MDVNTLAVANTARIHLKNAAGDHLYFEGQKVEIEVYGPGSEIFAQVEARASARSLKRMQDNDGKVTMPSPEDRRANEAEDLATLTAGFHNLTRGTLTGSELYRETYADPKLGFIAAQVAKFVNGWGNFSAGSATS